MMLDDAQDRGTCIKVIGVGGGGSNAINSMVEAGVEGVQFIAANTDKQALANSQADIRIQIGEQRTRGLGAGSNPAVGQEAAQESASIIQEQLKGADMVFITAGMGGGTGTGAAPIIAGIARQLGALTVGVVTKPFNFEGSRRRKQAEAGIENLKKNVDSLITIPNQRLLQIAGDQLTLVDAFRQADSVLVDAVRAISELITKTGLINTDFNDVSHVMVNKGLALMGTGVGEGPNRATDAAEAAISSPLLDDISLEGATHVLINITAPKSATLAEINEAATLIEESAGEDATVIWGHVINEDETCEDVKITIIATGFEKVDAAADDPFMGAGKGNYFRDNSGFISQTRMPSAALPVTGTMQSGVYAAQANANYQDTLSTTSMEIADKMREIEAQSENLYSAHSSSGNFASASRQPSSYAPTGNTSYAQTQNSSYASKSEGYGITDVFAQVQKPVTSTSAPAQAAVAAAPAKSNAASRAISEVTAAVADDLNLDEEDYNTPAFIRKNPNKKFSLD